MAKQSEEKRFSLRVAKPSVTQLNKKNIILLSAGVLFIIILVVLMAFSGSSSDTSQQPKFQKAFQSQPKNIKANKTALNKLPDSYQDAKQIDHLLNRNQKPKVIEHIPAELASQLAMLRSQQAALRAQLNGMRHRKIPVNKPLNTLSPLDREAMTSAIFFSGGAPRPAPKPKVLTAAEKKAAKSHSGTPGHSGAKGDSYQSQNMQAQKLDFLNKKPSKAIYNKNAVQYPPSKYMIQAGTYIPAILQTKLVSSLPGMIVAVVSQNVYDSISGHYLLIPKGTKLIGQYSSQISYGQEELQAKFIRLIRPDGSSIVLPNAAGVNDNGVTGFADEVDNHWGKIIGSAVLATIFNLPSIVATNQMGGTYVSPQGGYVQPSLGMTAKASALQSVGQTASQVGSQLTQRSLNLQPTIIIHAGYQFSVLVQKDMVLPPYHMPDQN